MKCTHKYLLTIPGVYLIKNKTNGKVYVGSSINVRKRMIQHLSHLRIGIHHSKYLQRAWNKYGIDNLSVHILEYTKDILKRELYWMNFYQSYRNNNGYNICKIPNTTFGRFHSEETKRKMSINRSGILVGENNHFYGKQHTIESKIKISNANKGNLSGAKNHKYRHDLDNHLILKLYNEGMKMKEMAKLFNASRDTISSRIKQAKT